MKKIIKKMISALGYDVVRQKEDYGLRMNYFDIQKFLYFKRMFDMVKDIPGDIVECGVGSGKSFAYFASLVKEESKKRNLWGFDSFEGFPEPSDKDRSLRNAQKGQDKTSLEHFYNFMLGLGLGDDFLDSQVSVVKGFFKNSLKEYKGERIALLHLDVDLYDSYLTALGELFPKVIKGGIVLFDEYLNFFSAIKFPGAQKAIDEYFKDKNVKILKDKICGKFYVKNDDH